VPANALGYAVERRLLPANPLDQIQWKASQVAETVAETVDRRSVANPAQAGRLLKAVQGQGRRGQHMEAFFGCLYYAPRGCVGQGKFLLKTMLPPRPDTQRCTEDYSGLARMIRNAPAIMKGPNGKLSWREARRRVSKAIA
jgi:hypothetical protein